METLDSNNNMEVESALNISPADKDDFLEQVMEVERSAWPPELQASKQKFESRFNIFSQGFFVVRLDGKIKGVATSQITTYDETSSHTWDEITDNGMIGKTHNPQGNALYVVSVGVGADVQGRGVGGKLVQSQLELAKKLGPEQRIYIEDYLRKNLDNQSKTLHAGDQLTFPNNNIQSAIDKALTLNYSQIKNLGQYVSLVPSLMTP